jgi:hypothetical protein
MGECSNCSKGAGGMRVKSLAVLDRGGGRWNRLRARVAVPGSPLHIEGGSRGGSVRTPTCTLTPLAGGTAGIRHDVLFWEICPIFR